MWDPTTVAQFTGITGADEATAKFFLSASNGNCDAAVSAFFESGGIVPSSSEAPRSRPTRPAPTSKPPTKAPPPSAGAPSGGIATLGSLREDDKDEDEGQGYYAGGEKSGQMIQDPKKRSDEDEGGPADLTEAIFERARARGPRTDEEREQFEGGQSFTGAGYRLGDETTEVETRPRPDVMGRRNITRVLTFFANGFQVDEGPLRRFDDPANEAFLNDVNRGVVPREMEEPGVGDVSITLVDKKREQYVEKKKNVVAFSGGGQRLDGGASSTRGDSTTAVDTAGAAAAVRVDESRPMASVQVRLSDGTRVVARLNEDNTVGELREFVRASRPSVGNFVLSTTFPRKVLEDDGVTIKEAQLKGAVVVQTLK